MNENETKTFVAKSGNVCLLSIQGFAGERVGIDATWDKTPSKKDIKECNLFVKGLLPPQCELLAARIENDQRRQATFDQFLYRSPRN